MVITEFKQAEEALRRQLEELRVVNAVAVAGAEATDADDLIERATRIIGEALYPDNFGLLLVDKSRKVLRHHPSYRRGTGEKPNFNIPMGQGVTGKVAISGKPYRVPDVSHEPIYLESDQRTRSELSVPLKVGDRVIGVINAESGQINAFTEEDERLLTTLAGQLATAIERLKAESAERNRADQLAVLYQASQDIVASLEPGEIYAAVHRATSHLMPVEAFVITLVDEPYQQINPVYLVDRGQVIQAQPIPVDRGLSGYVISTGKALHIGDSDQIRGLDAHWVGEPDETRSILAVPISLGGKVFGMLSAQSYLRSAYSPDDLKSLRMLANQTAIAISNARLFEETQRRLEEVSFLGQIIAITATEKDLPTALKRVCAELVRFFKVPETGFALFNSHHTAAHVIAEYVSPGRPSGLGVLIPLVGDPAMAYTMEHKTPIMIADVQKEPMLAHIQEILEQRSIVSLLIVPIILAEEIVGLLVIDDIKPRYFTAGEIALVQKAGSQIGQVLERLGLFAATQEQAELMAHLASLSETLNHPLSLTEVIKAIGEGLLELGRSDGAVLFLRGVGGTASCPWARGLSANYLDEVSQRIQEMPGNKIMQNPEPVLVPNVADLAPDLPSFDLILGEHHQAVGLWPLVYQDNVVAVVGCYYDKAHFWSDAEQEVMLAFARQAAVALQNARLFEETSRRAAHLETLNAIILAAAGASDLEDLLGLALDQVLRTLDLKMGAIWASGKSVLRELQVEDEIQCVVLESSLGLEMKSPVFIEDWKQIPANHRLACLTSSMNRFQVRASLTVPILAGGRRIGGLSLASPAPRSWLADEIALIEGVGRQLGGAIERIQLLEKIQAHALQIQQIMDSVPDGVILLDEHQNIVLANPAAQEHLSLLQNTPQEEALTRLGDKPLGEYLQENSLGGWYEIKANHPASKVFELAVQPLVKGEHSEGWVLVLRDVTQERENQTRIQMQERLATVGQLAAGIAHDFNNILAAIVVYADLLKQDPSLPLPSRERLAIIHEQVHRAASLIRQILDFSRRSVMEQSTLDLLPFLKEMDKLLRRVLPETIRVELGYHPDRYQTIADPTRLQQVFMNLAVNARDAMPDGGVLRFEIEREVIQPKTPPCPNLNPGVWIRISVSDTGSGISPENLPHIFEPFYTTKPVGQGTGLGLAQAYGIIKQHGGHIDVESQQGAGTVFRIFLPALEISDEDEFASKGENRMEGDGEMILVVEDDTVARQAMQDLLQAYNYQALVAKNGLEALEIYQQHWENIALVVSDIVMPKMGGVELYYALKEKWPDVKILFVTGHPLSEQDQQLLERGEVRWLQKPYSIQTFNEAIQQLLDEETT